MKDLQYYRNLPETIRENRIVDELNYVLNCMKNQLSVEDSMEILSDKCLLRAIEDFLFKCIDFNCENVLDNIIHISIALGLKTVFDYIIESKHKIIDVNILNMVIDYEKEIIDISDPYIGLR